MKNVYIYSMISPTTGDAKYGTIKTIPTGLIVTNDPKDDFVKVDIKYPRISTVVRKHVADLHGFVDCDIIYNNGNWILQAPLQEAHNVTNIQLADESIQTELIFVRESLKSEVSVDLESIFNEIEANMKTLRDKSYESKESGKSLLSETQKLVNNARSMASELREKHAASSSGSGSGAMDDEALKGVLAKCSEVMPKYERELRALRYEIAM